MKVIFEELAVANRVCTDGLCPEVKVFSTEAECVFGSLCCSEKPMVFVTVCYLKALCYAGQWSLEQGGLEVD